MNLTKNELLNLPLEEMQKKVIELGEIAPGDKEFANAKAVIDTITSSKKYKEPKKVKVKALDNVPVDGRDVKKDQEVDLYPWQYAALSRFFEKIAAAALVALLLLLGMPARAQQYSVVTLGSLTNNLSTNTFALDGSNGTNCAITVNTALTYKKVIGLTRFSEAGIYVSFALRTSGSQVTAINLDWSGDGTNWVALPQWTITPNGTTTVAAGTNLTIGSFGYLRLNSVTNGNAEMTNLLVQVITKPNRSGAIQRPPGIAPAPALALAFPFDGGDAELPGPRAASRPRQLRLRLGAS